MDKLIHTPEGKLISHDPFSVEGTKVSHITKPEVVLGTILLRRDGMLPPKDTVFVRQAVSTLFFQKRNLIVWDDNIR